MEVQGTDSPIIAVRNYNCTYTPLKCPNMDISTVSSFGFGAWGLGLRDWGFGALGLGNWGLGFGVWDLGFRARALRALHLPMVNILEQKEEDEGLGI